MKKLTKAQASAIETIAANPGRVEAETRLDRTMLRINGNAEESLIRAGLVRKVEVRTETIFRGDGRPYVRSICAWELVG